jgi:hypothetical protein
LESDIQAAAALLDRVEAHPDIMSLPIEGNGNEMNLTSGTLEFPSEMVPCSSGGRRTANASGYPVASRSVPDAPGSRASKITLRAKDISVSAGVLIGIEFQSLDVRDGLDIKVEIVSQVLGFIVPSNLTPPQSSAPSGSSHVEAGG